MSRFVLFFAFWCVFGVSGASHGASTLPSDMDLEPLRALPVQHDGRWPPLDTLARDVVESVTGTERFRGSDPLLLLLAWTYDPATWQNEPLISIRNAELRAVLELPHERDAFSYAELSSHQPLLRIMLELRNRPEGSKADPLDAKVAEINKKLHLLESVFRGQVIRPIPHDGNVTGAWRSLPPPGVQHVAVAGEASRAWLAMSESFRAGDAARFAEASRQFAGALASLPAAHRPTPKALQTELRYNRLRPFRTGWMGLAGGTALSLVALFVKRKWFDYVAALGLLLGFGYLTYGLSLRWTIAGRIPAANMYESLLFLSWGAGAFAILAAIFLRDRLAPLTAAAIATLALFLSDVLPLDHYIRPIMPVLLDTVWMSIHVPIIMISYAVLAVGVVIAHVQLISMAIAPRRVELAAAIDKLHYWYISVGVLVLAAGIITGSMWAASSWGRYWGWDPKEVWSLAALLGYLAILHVRVNRENIPWWGYICGGALAAVVLLIIVRELGPLTLIGGGALAGAAVAILIFLFARGRFATALKSVLAFWLIIMTYVGVNYILGIGLHSYGFGAGAVVRYCYLAAAIDLALVALCTLVYVARLEPLRDAVQERAGV